MKTLATIGILLPDATTSTSYMLVDADICGTWEPLEQDATGAPFVYSRLSDAERALEEARAFDDYPADPSDVEEMLTFPYRTV